MNTSHYHVQRNENSEKTAEVPEPLLKDSTTAHPGAYFFDAHEVATGKCDLKTAAVRSAPCGSKQRRTRTQADYLSQSVMENEADVFYRNLPKVVSRGNVMRKFKGGEKESKLDLVFRKSNRTWLTSVKTTC